MGLEYDTQRVKPPPGSSPLHVLKDKISPFCRYLFIFIFGFDFQFVHSHIDTHTHTHSQHSFKMQLSNTISLLSPLLLLLASTSSASAVSAPELGFLSKRQAPGTPKFECHSNCGEFLAFHLLCSMVIVMVLMMLRRPIGTAIKLTKASTGDEACANSELQKLYTACTACAEEEGIWQYYGPSLSKLSSCNWGSEESKNDDATPVGQNTTATPTVRTEH